MRQMASHSCWARQKASRGEPPQVLCFPGLEGSHLYWLSSPAAPTPLPHDAGAGRQGDTGRRCSCWALPGVLQRLQIAIGC